MVFINPPDGTTIKQLFVKNIEIGAVGPYQHIFGGTSISTFENDFNFNVVKHTDFVVHWVVTHRLDAHSTHLNATHGAVDTHSGQRLRAETTRLIGGLVIDEWHVFTFTHIGLTR